MGKLAVLILLGVGGWYGYQIMNADHTVFALSKKQVTAMLTEATTTLPRRDGDGKIRIWSTGTSTKGVALNMQYASWAPLLSCQAVVTVVAPDQTRVVPDCSSGPASESAMARTQDQLQVPMFEEHIQATLNKRAFNRGTVDQKETAAVFANLGAMQQEALQMADEAARMEAEANK